MAQENMQGMGMTTPEQAASGIIHAARGQGVDMQNQVRPLPADICMCNVQGMKPGGHLHILHTA